MSDRADDQSRAALHSKVDAILDERARWESERQRSIEGNPATDYDVPGQGNAIFEASLSVARELGGPFLREDLAPTHFGSGPQQRKALIAGLRLLETIWPSKPRTVGAFAAEPLWLRTVIEAVEQLDEGQTHPMLERAVTGQSSQKHHQDRFRLLGALWASNLEAQGMPAGLANDTVAKAFGVGKKGGADRNRAATVANWRKSSIELAAGVRASSIASEDAKSALKRAVVVTGSEEEISLALAHLVFQDMSRGPRSLDETGARYQRLQLSLSSKPQNKKRRAKTK